VATVATGVIQRNTTARSTRGSDATHRAVAAVDRPEWTTIPHPTDTGADVSNRRQNRL
jgi:hypothetical protein